MLWKSSTSSLVYFRVNKFMCSRNASKYSVLLPKTDFPLRVAPKHRKERDLWVMKTSSFESLYQWQRENVPKHEEFILHDGPPYANGKPHMGHALNKILKDIILRNKLLCGKFLHYMPGWDCHGLPIELKALENINLLKPDWREIRQKAKSFASETIMLQKAAFIRWGVLADWDGACYYTFSSTYVKSQLQLFTDLYNKGLIYRDYKPVYWSPSSMSALAESELEYKNDHVSVSIYLKLKLEHPLPECIAYPRDSPIFLVVWTTTPWTLPANQAVCYHPEKKYCLVRCKPVGKQEQYFIIASELRSSLEKQWSCNLSLISEFQGNFLQGNHYLHPLRKHESMPLLPAYHVCMKKGTGLVHTAPAHGPDDFLVALAHRLPVTNLVLEDGSYSTETGYQLSGKDVLSGGQSTVLELLRNDIIHEEKFVHSYPYDWRTKQPVILRASLQWFVDTNTLKETAVSAMKDVTVVPANFEKPMLAQLAQRPYWCISRQRSWGVPIPVFYHKSLLPDPKIKPIINRDITNRLCDLIMEKGVDQWWLLNPEDLIGEELMQKHDLTPSTIEKGMDIMDIWFDSGVSWNSVLPQGKQADLYLEGVDQFGGWFQSSLLTSVATTGQAPYKSIFVHGFVLDHEGRKMSKSVGNVVDPMEVIDGDGRNVKANGIDALRWWVASHVSGSGSSVSVSEQLIHQASQDVQKLRSVMRFLLGNLDGVSATHLEKLDWTKFGLVDRYVLNGLSEFVKMTRSSYDEMNFRKVTTLLVNFINNEVSAFYSNIKKHRLYCYRATDGKRLAALYVLSEILDQVTLVTAPILPHLVEEIEMYHPWHSGKGGIFRNRRFNTVRNYYDSQVPEAMKPFLELRSSVNKMIGQFNSQEWDVKIIASDPRDFVTFQVLQPGESSHESDLTELLQVSKVTLLGSSDQEIEDTKVKHHSNLLSNSGNESLNQYLIHNGSIQVILSKSLLRICPRCRRYTSFDDSLCPTCLTIVSFE